MPGLSCVEMRACLRKTGSWGALLFACVLAAILPACRPASPSAARHHAIPATVAGSEVGNDPAAQPPQLPSGPAPVIHAPRVASWISSGVSFEGVTFDSRSHRLVVVDQNEGPGSKFSAAAQAAGSVAGIAAVNAGFFTLEGEPLGLAISGGNAAGQWNTTSSLGSGVWYQTPDGGTRIARREVIGPTAARRMPELLQSGPMLVEGGRVVHGLRDGEPRPRTLIAWDGRNQWWIGCAAPCSMPALAAALATGHGPGFPVHTALNLDGGRSSELWVAGAVVGGPLTRRQPMGRKVRNHLVLLPR